MMTAPTMKSIFAIAPGAGDLPKLALAAPDGARLKSTSTARTLRLGSGRRQERLFLEPGVPISRRRADPRRRCRWCSRSLEARAVALARFGARDAVGVVVLSVRGRRIRDLPPAAIRKTAGASGLTPSWPSWPSRSRESVWQ